MDYKKELEEIDAEYLLKREPLYDKYHSQLKPFLDEFERGVALLLKQAKAKRKESKIEFCEKKDELWDAYRGITSHYRDEYYTAIEPLVEENSRACDELNERRRQHQTLVK